MGCENEKKKWGKKAFFLPSLNCEHFTFYLYRRQTGNFYQSAIIRLPYCVYQKHVGEKKKKEKSFLFLFLQCLILQPQCKHSLALLFGFIELTFSQEYTKQKRKKKRKKEKQDHPCLFLSAVSHSGMYPLRVLYCPFSFLSSLVQCKSWRPVADGSRLLTHTVKQIARRKKNKNK